MGTSLVIQWLKLCASNAGGVGSILCWGTKIPHAPGNNQKKKKKKKDLTGWTYIKWKHGRMTRSRWIWVGSRCIKREVMGSELPVSAVLGPGSAVQASGGADGKAAVFLAHEQKDRVQGNHSCWRGGGFLEGKGQRGDPQILPGC